MDLHTTIGRAAGGTAVGTGRVGGANSANVNATSGDAGGHQNVPDCPGPIEAQLLVFGLFADVVGVTNDDELVLVEFHLLGKSVQRPDECLADDR